MPRKSAAQRHPQAQDVEETFVDPDKAIRADAFDQFIEAQLQRVHSDADQSESDVVCHVY